jgi:hypothetical protein
MKDPRRLTRQAMVLLVLMTCAAFGGPIGFGAILRGGPRAGWPPDRPVEWAALVGISGIVLALMVLSVAVSLANQREAKRFRQEPKEPGATA